MQATEKSPRRLNAINPIRHGLALLAGWTFVVGLSLAWNLDRQQSTIEGAAKLQARTAHDKDLAYRRWNAERGGVYAVLSEQTPANPHLKVLDREIPGPDGKTLTLVNPAYMTRQVHELERAQGATRSHITSLKPLRPENAPDDWEREALLRLEKGDEEVASIQEIEGEDYMRLMRPLMTSAACMKCHQHQGYQVGDVRGGISVSVVLAPMKALAAAQRVQLILCHVVIWLAGLAVLLVSGRHILNGIRERDAAEQELRRHKENLLLTVADQTRELRERNNELQAAQQVTEKAEEELAFSNRELDDFAYTVSHDLKEPLRGIRNYSQFLLEDHEEQLDSEGQQMLESLPRLADRMGELLDSLLKYSRIGRAEYLIEACDMNLLVEEVLESYGVMIAERSLDVRVPRDLPVVDCDRIRVGEILGNLIANAAKYNDKAQPWVEIGHLGSGPTFYVRDNGIGIPEEHQQAVFGMFRRLHRDEYGGGAGAGLTIVKKMVERHGGEIWLESTAGEGTTFFFTLSESATSSHRGDKLADVA